jgi:cell division protein ZapE
MPIISRYQQALTNKEILPNPSQEEAIAILDQTFKDHEAHPKGAYQGVYLWGEVGRGKTWLMDMFYAHLPTEKKRRLHFQEFMQYVHTELHKLQGHANPLNEIAAQLANQIDVLCLDELLVEDVADAMILGTLLQALLMQNILLVITANLAPDQLYARGWQRERFLPAIQVLKQQLRVLQIQHEKDYRRLEALVNQTYFHPDGPETEPALAQIFSQAAHQPIYVDTTINVNAHILIVRQVSSHVLWCSFASLCGNPHSAQDYLLLAKRFTTILVSQIPVLDQAHENEARRFISLVDACYDRRIRLILSADVPLAELYQGKLLQHAFQRTTSRLWEMQTEKYGR